MKNDDACVIRVYSNDVEAGLAASWLDAAEIAYELVSDDVGGAFPNLQITRGIKLVVNPEDEERANEILERCEEEIDPSILEGDPSAARPADAPPASADPDSVPTREIRREGDPE